MPTYFAPPSGDHGVAVVRQIIELVDDDVFCGEGGKDPHAICLITSKAARWPDPNPLHDLDEMDDT